MGRFVPLTTIGGTALLGGNNPAGNGEWNEAWIQERSARFGGATGPEWDRAAIRESARFVLFRPGRWLIIEGMKLGKFFSPKPGSFYRGRLFHPVLELAASPLFWMPLLFLLPFGIVRARGLEPTLVFAALAVGSQLVTTLVFFALVRYRIPYLPAYALLAVAGGQWIWPGRGRVPSIDRRTAREASIRRAHRFRSRRSSPGRRFSSRSGRGS
jgi:hypothetical protein